MVACVGGEESVSSLDCCGSSCFKLHKDDVFSYSHSEFPPLSRKLLSEVNRGNIKQRLKKEQATCLANKNDDAFGGEESVEKKETKQALRKRLRLVDDLWCFKFSEIWEDSQPFQNSSSESQQKVKRIDWEDLLTFEFQDTFVYARKFKHVLRPLERISKNKSVAVLRDKCLPERNISKIQCKGKKLFSKSDISIRRRCRSINISENNLRQKENVEKSLEKRGITRDRGNVSFKIDVDALNSAMPSTLTQQRRSRMSKVAVPCGSKTNKESVNESTGKRRQKPRWKETGRSSKNQQPQKFELHETNIGYVDTISSDDVLWQLINIQHRELSPEDYDLLLRLDEQVAPKTVSKDILNGMTVVTIDEDKMAELRDLVCSVCMECYSLDQRLKYLPCNHFYHEHCIDKWLLYCDTKCPLDGTEIS